MNPKQGNESQGRFCQSGRKEKGEANGYQRLQENSENRGLYIKMAIIPKKLIPKRKATKTK